MLLTAYCQQQISISGQTDAPASAGDHFASCLLGSPVLAPSGGRVVSAILPLSGEKQTSSERVKSDAIDPERTCPLWDNRVRSARVPSRQRSCNGQ